MTKPALINQVAVRAAENGFVAVYDAKEYVFLTVQALNAWMVTISAGG